jgi:hypothetical protein
VWRGYVEQYGDEEFVAVREEAALDARAIAQDQ